MTRMLFSCSHQGYVTKDNFRVFCYNHTLLKNCKQDDGAPVKQSTVRSTDPQTDRGQREDRERTHRAHTEHPHFTLTPSMLCFAVAQPCTGSIPSVTVQAPPVPVGHSPSTAMPRTENQSRACPVQTSWCNGHTGM